MITFIAALTSTIVIEESALLGDPQPALLFLINILEFELDPAFVSCVLEAVTVHTGQ